MSNITPIKPKPDLEVPLTLRGASQLIEKRRRGNKDQDGTFDLMSETAASITAAADKVKASVAAILDNQMQTPIRNTALAQKAAQKVWDKLAPKLTDVHHRARQKIEELEASAMPPAPKNAMDQLAHAEIRSALRNMPSSERSKAIHAAIEAGDDAFVSAACTGSPILTGLGKAEQALHLNNWQRKRHGPTMERIARLEEGLDQFDQLSTSFMEWSLSLLADKNAAVIAAERSEELAKQAMDNAS